MSACHWLNPFASLRLTLLLAISAEPECENAANGAVVWHLSRVMHDIDIHCKQREYASNLCSEPFIKPSKILDGFLFCMSFGIHIVYRERLYQAHPASHASLADFRTFIQANLEEWSGKALTIRWYPSSCLHFFCEMRIYSYVCPLSVMAEFDLTRFLIKRRLFLWRASVLVMKAKSNY